MAGAKFTTVDEYIATFPKHVQDGLEKIRDIIQKAVPEAEEIISYNIPAYKIHRPFIYISAYTDHYSLSCPPPFTVFEVFKKELSEYTTSKSTIQFSFDKQLPVKLINDIVEFRAKESLRS